MKRTLTTVEEVINALGGPTATGKWLGIGQNAVSMWKTRGIAPGWHFRVYLRLRRKGMDVDPSVFGIEDFDDLNGKRGTKRARQSRNTRSTAHAA